MFVEKGSPLSQLYCEVYDIVSDACGNRFVESKVAIKIMTSRSLLRLTLASH